MIGVSVLIYLVPLFHIVPLEAARRQFAAADFDAAEFVDTFWQGPLLDSTRHAVDAAELLDALKRDFDGTTNRFGHRLGLSGNTSFLVSGQGRIVAVDSTAIAIALHDDGQAELTIETGPMFGNAIRDGSGLLDVSDFANAQDFNALSAEINRRVEEQVLPLLEAGAAIGKTVRFAGGVEIADSAGAPSALVLVPVVIEFP